MAHSPQEDPTSIGNILVSMGFLTQEQLVELVEKFNESKDELLGEFLVKNGAITENNVETALIRQKVMRGDFSDKAVQEVMLISHKRDQKIIIGIDSIITVTQTAIEKINGK